MLSSEEQVPQERQNHHREADDCEDRRTPALPAAPVSRVQVAGVEKPDDQRKIKPLVAKNYV